MTNQMMEILQVLKDNNSLLRDLKTMIQQHLEGKSEPLLNKNQVMDMLGISDSTYRRYVKEGRLNPMRLNGIDLYNRSDLLKELQESRRKGRI